MELEVQRLFLVVETWNCWINLLLLSWLILDVIVYLSRPPVPVKSLKMAAGGSFQNTEMQGVPPPLHSAAARGSGKPQPRASRAGAWERVGVTWKGQRPATELGTAAAAAAGQHSPCSRCELDVLAASSGRVPHLSGLVLYLPEPDKKFTVSGCGEAEQECLT